MARVTVKLPNGKYTMYSPQNRDFVIPAMEESEFREYLVELAAHELKEKIKSMLADAEQYPNRVNIFLQEINEEHGKEHRLLREKELLG